MATTVFNILTPFGMLALQSETIVATAPSITTATIEVPETGLDGAQLVLDIATPASVGTELMLTVNAKNIRIPNAAGSYALLLDKIFPGSVPAQIDLRLEPLDGDLRGSGIDYRAYQETFAVTAAPVLTAASLTVGTALTYTEPVTVNGAPSAVAMTLQRSADEAFTTPIDVGPAASNEVIPNNATQYLRVRAVVTAPGGGTSTHYSAAIGPIVAVSVTTPAKLATTNFAFGTPFYRPAGQTTWRTARIVLSGLPSAHLDTTLSEYRWTGSASPTDDNSEQCTRVSSTELEMIMDDPTKRLTSAAGTNLDAAGKKIDYSVVKASDSFASKYRLQVRIRATTGSAWSDWSEVSDAITMAEIVTTPVDTTTPDHRPLLMRLPGEMEVNANFPARFVGKVASGVNKGLIGGEGLQWMHAHSRGVNNPDVIYAVQDMGGMRKSNDGGDTWFSPPAAGLGAFFSWDVFCDPSDSDFVIYGGAYAWSPVDSSQDGIWLSKDGAKTFVKVQTITSLGAAAAFRYSHSTICRYPLTSGTAAAARFGFVGNTTTSAGSQTLSSIYVYASTGGESWTLKNTLAASTYGKVSQLAQHPTTENTKYLVCARGIFRTTTWGNATPTWAQVWSGTFPDASLPNRIWIDPGNANRMLVSCSGGTNKGVWYTTDGGTNWTQALSGYAAVNVAVGAADADGKRWVYVNSAKTTVSGGASSMRVRKWNGTGFDGSGWKTPTTNQPATIPANYTSVYKTLSGQGTSDFSGFCDSFPHPTIHAESLQYGYHYYWQTDDGGTSYDASNSFNAGLNVVNFLFDPDVWDRLHVSAADVCYIRFSGGMLTADRSYNISDTQRSAMGVGTRSASGIALVPQSATVAARRGRLIIACGEAQAGGVFVRDEDGTGYPSGDAGWTAINNVIDERRQARVDPDDPKRVYLGDQKSDDYGATWTSLGRKFAGLGIDTNNILGYTSGSSGSVAYSTNRGSSWSNVATGLKLDDGKTGKPFVYLDPTNDNRFYTVESAGGVWDLACWQKGTSGWAKTSIGVRGMFTATSRRPNIFYIQAVAVDHLDPRIIYCGLRGSGPRWLFRGLWNAGFTSITWTEITRNLPTCNLVGEMRVHPKTGELFVPTVNGVYVAARPALASDGTAYTTAHTVSGSIHSGLPIPPDNGWRTLTDLL